MQVLAAELPNLVGGLSFKKSMRWDGFGVAYSRPMRWLLALHGSTPIPFSYGGLVAGPTTRVLRNAAQPELPVASAAAYGPLLQQQAIELDLDARRQAIWAGAAAAAAEVGGFIPESAGGDLLDEVANLVESPTVIRGAFDPAFLELPECVCCFLRARAGILMPAVPKAYGTFLDTHPCRLGVHVSLNHLSLPTCPPNLTTTTTGMCS